MEEPSTVHSTFVIERSYAATPARVYAAFSDPAQKRRWFAESEGHALQEFELDFRAGGRERARFRFKEGTPVAGIACTNESVYQVIVPQRRIVVASNMSFGDKCISASLCTFEFLATGNGTDLIFTHQGAFFEGSDGPQMREHGWRHIFVRLEKELAR